MNEHEKIDAYLSALTEQRNALVTSAVLLTAKIAAIEAARSATNQQIEGVRRQ